MECYKDLQDIIDTFSTFANHTKNRLIACGDNPNCHSLNTKTPITYYGFNEDNDVIIKIIMLQKMVKLLIFTLKISYLIHLQFLFMANIWF